VSNTNYYATLRWAPEDVLTLRPNWTLDRCEEWLEANQRHIQARLCELGWEVIETLLDGDEK
jgi:hypothetical protein